jgi:hypothetical protein
MAMAAYSLYNASVPVLSSFNQWPYGTYDNGAKVFLSFYDNFAGQSLSSKWAVINNGGSTSYSVGNGLLITSTPATGCPPTGFQSTSTFTTNTVEDFFGQPPVAANPGDGVTTFGFADSSNWAYSYCGGNGPLSAIYYPNSNYYLTGLNTGLTYAGYATSQTTNNTWTIQNGAGRVASSINYGSTVSATRSPATTTADSLGFFSQAGDTMPWFLYWVRVRAYPPGGTMPSVTFGSVV